MRIPDADGTAILSILVGGGFGLAMTALLVSEADRPASWAPPPAAFPATEAATPPVTRAAEGSSFVPGSADAPLTPAEAIWEVDRLLEFQRVVQMDVRDLSGLDGTARAERIEGIRELKTHMHAAVVELERQLDLAALIDGRADPEATRGPSAAADVIRESRLQEALQYSMGTIEQWDAQSAEQMELNIEGHLLDVWDRIASGMAPVVLVEGVEVELESRLEIPLDDWVIDESPYDGMVLGAVMRAWGESTGDPGVGLTAVRGVQLVPRRQAAQQYGPDAAGGAVNIRLVGQTDRSR